MIERASNKDSFLVLRYVASRTFATRGFVSPENTNKRSRYHHQMTVCATTKFSLGKAAENAVCAMFFFTRGMEHAYRLS